MGTEIAVTKRCAYCGKEMSLREFFGKSQGVRKYARVCVVCERARERYRKGHKDYSRQKRWREKHCLASVSEEMRVKVREYVAQHPRFRRKLREKYGMTVPGYLSLLEKQQGKCAACHVAPKDSSRLVVDHNHETGEVRGLLCNNCNSALGFAKDQPATLIALVSYLSQAK